MEDYIAGRINVDDCAASMSKPIVTAATARNPQTMEDAVFAVNSFINTSAVENLQDQPQILALVKAIQKLPPLEVPHPKVDEDGAAISLGDEGQRLWEDMPGFGHLWGDSLRGMFLTMRLICPRAIFS